MQTMECNMGWKVRVVCGMDGRWSTIWICQASCVRLGSFPWEYKAVPGKFVKRAHTVDAVSSYSMCVCVKSFVWKSGPGVRVVAVLVCNTNAWTNQY